MLGNALNAGLSGRLTRFDGKPLGEDVWTADDAPAPASTNPGEEALLPPPVAAGGGADAPPTPEAAPVAPEARPDSRPAEDGGILVGLAAAAGTPTPAPSDDDPPALPTEEAEAAGTQAGIRAATALPTDPMLSQQWHLGNTGGLLDLRVRGVWDPASGAAYTGAGVRVVVIDDGFDYNHVDLATPYDEGLDFDFDESDLDPFGTSSDAHGTAVTGIIGADNNGVGVVGVAYDSSLVGYRVHSFITDFWLQNIRDAIHHAAVSAQGDVANISQGIANDEDSEWGIGYSATRFDEIETSIGTAVASGRGGLGMTIVKSAGNSRTDNYDVNADDWTNDTRQVVVGAVDQNGFVSSYSSYGAALLVSAFGTPLSGQVVTTDRTGAAGYNSTNYTSSFNGTSAAAPMVSGVVALMYDANPSLGWRDVQSILALTARQVGSEVGSGPAGSERYTWAFNGANTWNGGGLHFSNDYGYGLVDALAAVRLAETWLTTLPAQTNGNQLTNTMDMLNAAVVIPDGNVTGTTFSGTAGFDDEVERVTVRVTFSTTFTADLEIYITSPDGTTSELIDDVGGGSDFSGTWTFETQAFRGERAAGTWTVRIVDDAGGDTLTVSDVVVVTFGRASTSDRYVFTNEYSDYAGLFGHSTTLTDSNGGTDEINASAVSSNSVINLNAGGSSTIDGVATGIAAGTSIENAYAGDGNDTLIGNSLGNRLLGGRGNDSLDGGGGNDSLYGGDGNDVLSQNFGGPNEVMDGGAGIDTGDWSYNTFDQWNIDLAAGTAKIGAAVYAQLASIENAIGGQVGDTITGTSGANRLEGRGGDDSLDGGSGTDSLYGGDGNDVLKQNFGGPNEVMDGGTGIDTGDWSYNTTDSWVISLGAGTAKIGATTYAQLVSIENAIGGQIGDTLIGSSGANRLDGQAGDDSLDGGSGTDSLYGGLGNDILKQNTGGPNEVMDGGGGIDTGDWSYNASDRWEIDLDAGTAKINGTTYAQLVSIENAIGGQQADTISGTAADNRLEGRNGNDSLDGGSGSDTLYGGEGNDTLSQHFGGPNEVMDGGNGIDTGDWSYSFSDWTFDLVGGTAKIAGTTWALLTSIENVTGAQGADTILGTAGANALDGQDSADVLIGGGGKDLLKGGLGADRFVYLAASDSAATAAGRDVIGDWDFGDLFDLTGMDGNIAAGGLQKFVFRGATTNSSAAAAGEIWTYEYSGSTFVIGGVDGDGQRDFQIELTGLQALGVSSFLSTAANLVGTNAADNLTGGAQNDTLTGLDGADVLTGGGGKDSMNGGGGADRYVYAAVSDSAPTAAGRDVIGGWNASDVFDLTAIDADLGAGGLQGFVFRGATGNSSAAAAREIWTYQFGGSTYVIAGVDGDGVRDFQVEISGLQALTVANFLNTAANLTGTAGADTLYGAALGDTLAGGDGADVLIGGGGRDSMNGGAGADRFVYLAATDSAATAAGRDIIGGWGAGDVFDFTGMDGNIAVGGLQGFVFRGATANNSAAAAGEVWTYQYGGSTYVIAGVDGDGLRDLQIELNGLVTLNAASFRDMAANLAGTSGVDTLAGAGMADTLSGGAGNDSLAGNAGADVLTGGAGKDTLSGGGGGDRFVFAAATETAATTAGRDLITDWGAGDQIDVSTMDANIVAPGIQDFTFMGLAVVTTAAAAGELWYYQYGGNTFVIGGVDGDGQRDFQIELTGTHVLTGTSFIV